MRAVIAPDVPRFVAGDELRVRQIVVNLLGNAIKFTAAGEVTVRVRVDAAAAAAAAGGPGAVAVRVTITDTGIGVAADKQKLIFAPFEQADRSTTRKYGGTGLGLAISSQLVQLMHGAIEIESPWLDDETGARVQGTAFHFTARFGAGSEPARPADDRRAGVMRPLQVLVAEDNPVNQLLATRPAAEAGALGRRRVERPRGARPARRADARRDPDGRADAGDGRLRGGRRDPRARGRLGPAHADRRADRARAAGLPRGVHARPAWTST